MIQDLTNINKMNIEYKNDKNSANKLIDFIIDFLLESNSVNGGTIGTRECESTFCNRNCREGHQND